MDGSPDPTAIVRLMLATVSGGHPNTPWAPCRMARKTTLTHASWKYSCERKLSISRRELGVSNGMQRQAKGSPMIAWNQKGATCLEDVWKIVVGKTGGWD